MSDDSGPLSELLRLPRGGPTALLHSGGSGRDMLFTAPVAALTVCEPAGALDRLQDFVAAHHDCRCVGFLGYDLRDDVEPLPRRAADDLALPLLHLAAYRTWRTCRSRRLPADQVPPPPPARAWARLPRARFERAIERVIEHIRAGDLFQANLTQGFEATGIGDARTLFARLCALSPAPFAACVEVDADTAVLSSSPEEFLRRRGPAVRTRPIKGTRPRSDDPGRDRQLLCELLDSVKDRAELAMIVDLMRNDLGRAARVDSVRVGRFPEHASFAQVHHTFATVRARLRPGVGFAELLRATFPPGSVTGAPKLAAMEAIEQLEDVRRDVYTGAIGWFGPGDACHLSVAIRVLAVRGSRARFHAGGGITARSSPPHEYDESLDKIAGILRALGTGLEVPR